MRQNEVRKGRNRARKSELKTYTRQFEVLLKAGDVAQAEEQLRSVTKRLDQVAATSTMHKNAAARRKSRLAKKLNDLKAGK